jgi:hypothetical protein
MLGKARDLKITTINWWSGFEYGKPSFETLIQNWLKTHPELLIMNIDFELSPGHKQAYIIYKEGESGME